MRSYGTRHAGVILLLAGMLSLTSCAFLNRYASGHDFKSTEAALENARHLTGELRLLLGVPRDFESLKGDAKARREMRAKLERTFEGSRFNGAELRFWEYSFGNIDSGDDGWTCRRHVIVAPRLDTKRGLLNRPGFGQYEIRGRGNEPPLYASRSIANIGGERRFEYCYDIEGSVSDTWMRYFFIGEFVESGGPTLSAHHSGSAATGE